MRVVDLERFEKEFAEEQFPIDGSEALRPSLSTINGRPALRLPGDGRPIGEFAAELGIMLKEQEIFASAGHAVTLDADGQKLELATATWLRTWVEKSVSCYKARIANHQEIRLATTMSEDVAQAVLQSPQFLGHLRRVDHVHPCRMPVLRSNGAVELLPEGYDANSATYTALGSQYPFDMDLDEARDVIQQAFGEFPFADDAGRSKSVAVAAMLTIYGGALLPSGSIRPVFLYFGNAEGTGKTTAARLAAIAYGTVPVAPAPTTEDEWQKRLLAVAISGRRLMLLDNVKGFLNSPSLEAYTSSSRYGGRILGGNNEFEGEACATVLITGNQLTISPDMRRRSLVVELFIRELRAEDRHFSQQLDGPSLLALRPRLLGACWALVRAWDESGRRASSRQNSSFQRWCEIIGGIVEHSGYACPTNPAEIGCMGDTDTRDISRFGEVFVIGASHTFAEICGICAKQGLFERFTSDTEQNGILSRKAKAGFSRILQRYADRMIAPNLKFYIEGQGHARRYIVRTQS